LHFISTQPWLRRHTSGMSNIDKQRIAAVRTLEDWRGLDDKKSRRFNLN
jgi:hypothetical protein